MAIAELNEAVERNCNLAKAYADRGGAFAAKGDLDRALSDYDRAISIEPRNIVALLGRGSVFEMTNRLGWAFIDYDDAVRFSPFNADAYAGRARVGSRRGDLDKAIVDCKTAIGLRQDDASLWRELGFVHEKAGATSSAILDYTEAINLLQSRIPPSPSSDLYKDRARVYLANNDFDKAIADYEFALSIHGDRDSKGHYDLGLAYARNRHDRAAEWEFNRAIRLDGKNAEAYYALGCIYLKRAQNGLGAKEPQTVAKPVQGVPFTFSPEDGPFESNPTKLDAPALKEAIKYFAQAAETKPDYAEAYYGLGIALRLANQLPEAVDNLARAIRLNPKDAAAVYRQKAYVCSQLGRYDEAIRDASEAIREARGGAVNYAIRAAAYVGSGDFDRAVDDFAEAIRQNPRDPGLHYNRGIAFLRKNDPDSAIDEFNAVIGIAQNDAGAFKQRGIAWARKIGLDFDPLKYVTAQNPKALADLDHAIELNRKLNRKDTESFYYRALVQLKWGQFRAAISDLDMAIALKGNDGEFHFNRGKAYFAAGNTDLAARKADLAAKDFRSAISDLERAFALDPKARYVPYSDLYLGIAYEWLGDRDKANDHSKKAEAAGLRSNEPPPTFVPAR